MNPTNGKRVLLISNSTLYGSSYLDHAEAEIRDFRGNVKAVLFVPFALYDRDAYASMAGQRFEKMGYGLESIHTASSAQEAVNDAEAIFIGGGNTFRLLKALYDSDILQLIRQRVLEGMPYIGSSAGSNVAGPTIKTNEGHADRSATFFRRPRVSAISNQSTLPRSRSKFNAHG